MFKPNVKNERIKRRFFSWLKEANGRSESTIQAVEKSICLYEDFAKGADLATFNAEKAVAFKAWLTQNPRRGTPIALSTYLGYTMHLRRFFKWLSQQPGYRSKITPDMADYLKLSAKEERMATQTSPRRYPALEYVQQLTAHVIVRNEIDLRDRALIAFTLLSGMRDKAIVTLQMRCFDKTTLTVDQDPKKGVQTKFTKVNRSVLFPFDEKLLDYFLEWHGHLEKKGFSSQDPLFPRSKSTQGQESLSFEAAVEVEAGYWKGTGGMREIFRRRSQQAGLPYFPPHAYRHLAADLAIKSCRSGEQIKAVSQNLGHEHVATTLTAYGTLDGGRLSHVVGTLKPSDSTASANADFKEKLREFLDTM